MVPILLIFPIDFRFFGKKYEQLKNTLPENGSSVNS